MAERANGSSDLEGESDKSLCEALPILRIGERERDPCETQSTEAQEQARLDLVCDTRVSRESQSIDSPTGTVDPAELDLPDITTGKEWSRCSSW